MQDAERIGDGWGILYLDRPFSPTAMTAKTRRRLDMMQRTLAHFDQHPALWSGKAPIVLHVGTVREAEAAMEAAAGRQASSAPQGLTKNKEAARTHAAGLMAALSAKAGSYARTIGDADLEQAVDHSLSEWTRMAEEAFFADADRALDRIGGVLDALAGYEVDRADVTAARAAVNALRPMAPARDNVEADRAAATAALEAAYSGAVPSLDELDTLVPALVDDAAFVAEYQRVRRIDGD